MYVTVTVTCIMLSGCIKGTSSATNHNYKYRLAPE